MPRLSPAPTRLIGREREIERLVDELGKGRLVTLVGPPGVGKTRLCRELCHRDLVESADIVLCDLLEANGALDLCSAVARALEVDIGRGESVDDATSSIGEALRARETALLVLDNFEHLADECSAIVARWSKAGRPLLVTSRHRLGIEAECCIEVAPLGVKAAVATAAHAEGVELFLERFGVTHPRFQATPADLAAISRAVADLEGLPLAIELCAARVELPLADNLRRELDEARTSLGEAIEASWHLLTHEEKDALGHAAVFRGGFDARGVAAVIGNAGVDRAAELLERLADKSLVVRGDGGRFAMLAAIRELASARLAEGGLEADALGRHAEYFASAGRSLVRADAGPEAERARRALSAEADNFLAVVRRGTVGPRASDLAPETVLECALASAASSRGGPSLAQALSSVDAAVLRAQGELGPGLEARALLSRSALTEQMGRPAEALGSVKLAADRAEAAGEPELVARAIEARGRALLGLGSWREAREALERAAAAYAELAMPGHEARARVALGDTWFYVDDLATAQELYERALAGAEAAGDRSVLGMATSRLAIVEMELGRAASALGRFRAAIEIQQRMGDRAAEASASTYLAILEHDQGMLDVARARLETVVVVSRELGSRRTYGIASLYLGALLVEVGDDADAEVALDAAERTLGEVAAVSAQAYARGWRGALAARAGDVESAAQAFELARGHFRARREQSFYASAVELLAGHLDLARAQACAGDNLAAAAHRAAARRRLAPGAEAGQSDVRIARRLLASALGMAPAARQSETKVDASHQGALIVEESGGWFRGPEGSIVDLSRRAPLKKLLAMLLSARLREPGKPLATVELMHGVWTDTRDLPVLQNRLRVAIATLRKLGLSSTLFTKGGGYLLDPRRDVLAAE